MLKPFKEWDRIEQVIGVATAVAAVIGFLYAQFPWHATAVVALCLVLGLFLLFYPWRFPKWTKGKAPKSDDDFYPFMKWVWLCGICLALFVALAWSGTNVVWLKSPGLLAERMRESHLDQSHDRVLLSSGVWEAKLVQTNPPAPEVLVGLPTLDPNRLPQVSEVRRCVPALQVLRVAFGELSSYSQFIALVMLGVLGFCGICAGIERMHESKLRTDARKQKAAGSGSSAT